MASQTRKITLDTAALFFGRAVGLLLGMVRLNYLATYLGVDNFGILNFATYFTALFQSLFDLGMAQLITREIARNPSRSGEILGRAVLLKVIIVFIASILVGLVTLISGFDRVTNWAVLLTTVALAINGISTMFLSAFQAHRKMVTVSIANIANDGIISAAIILMIPTFPSVLTALVLTAVVSLINLGILVRVYYRVIGAPAYQANVESWKLLLKEGTPMAVSALGISIYTFIGPTLLKYYRGKTEVGLYSAGYRLISILTLIPTAFTQVIFPVFSDFFANAKHKLGKALADSLRVISIISIPLATGSVILAPKIFGLLYTEQYTPGIIVLQVAIIGNIFGYMDWVMYTYLLAINRQVFLMAMSLSVGACVVIAGLLVIPPLGFVTLPYLQAGTEFTLFLIQLYYLRRLGYSIFRPMQLAKPLMAAGIMGAFIFFLQSLNLFAVIAAGAAVYLLVLYVLRGLGEQEMSILRRLLARTPGTNG